MSSNVKIIVAVVLIVIGAHLLLYGFIRRKIAAAKAEGYRREADGDATTSNSSTADNSCNAQSGGCDGGGD